jgi:hypothetical protein
MHHVSENRMPTLAGIKNFGGPTSSRGKSLLSKFLQITVTKSQQVFRPELTSTPP